jgi:dihydrolipoamide dehydrogenase
MKKLPKSLIIIGGGVIGCEFASLYHQLGVEVTILELLPRLIPTEATNLSETLLKSFQKRGIAVHTQKVVQKVSRTGDRVSVEVEGSPPFTSDMALISVGRTVNTTDVGLEKAGVALTEKGAVAVNERMETNVDGIYAIGDVTAKWWLAHVATHQGIVAGDNATGHPKVMYYDAIPSVIYTDPEIASVGLSLEDAKKKGHAAIVGAFPFSALGKSQALIETEGFAQVIVDQHTSQILGAQVFGYEASTLIAEMALAVANELTLECLTETIHAHPTLPESWMQAGFIAEGMPVDFPPVRRRST